MSINTDNTLGVILTVGQFDKIMTWLDDLAENVPDAIMYTQDIQFELCTSQVKTDPPVTTLVHTKIIVEDHNGKREERLHTNQ